jgi:formamidopyrimidine-DNA glycosylase
MPELPELEVVREALQRRLVGSTVTGVRSFRPAAPLLRDLAKFGFAAA